ncbi:hypothetical protein K438DRAFT_1751614 [Mycena galopus ATCC 62051]|nr:hypothetical protein K438DRAFT_1751614 [Mycena galopus ATCC 62051]
MTKDRFMVFCLLVCSFSRILRRLFIEFRFGDSMLKAMLFSAVIFETATLIDNQSRPLRFSSPWVLQANWKLHSNINFGQQNTLVHTRFAEGWKRPKVTKSRNWFPFRLHTFHSTLSSVDSLLTGGKL